MKKIISILLGLVCLCGCSSGQTKPVLTEISFTAEITYYNEVYTLEAQMLKDATLVATIIEPEELKGLTLTVTKDGISAEYLGLTYKANEATLPFSKTVWDVYLPLLNIINTPDLVANGDGILTGEAENQKYTLTISPTGLPQTLELKDKRLLVRFYNTKINKEE